MIFGFQPGAVGMRLRPSTPELSMFLGEQASSARQQRDQTMDIFMAGWKEMILEGETLNLQGDLGTLSINSGENLTWKNKVDKGRTGLSPVSGHGSST